MKKNNIISFVILIFIIAGSITVSAFAMKQEMDKSAEPEYIDPVVAEIKDPDKVKEYEAVLKEPYPTVNGSILVGTVRRKKLDIISGKIAENTPCITLQQATDIITELGTGTYINEILKRFNRIAGAPEYEWGSGTYQFMYIVDETKGEYINVTGAGTIEFWSPEGKKYYYVYGVGNVINDNDEDVLKKWNESIKNKK